MMGRISILLWAAFLTGGHGQETYLRGGVTSEELNDIPLEVPERELGGESGGASAFAFQISCINAPGDHYLIEPCGKIMPDGKEKTYTVYFGSKLFSFTMPGTDDAVMAKQKWFTVLLTSSTLLLICLPLVILRFANKPAFDALFGNVPRADKDPSLSKAELANIDRIKMDSTGDGFIAPVNYYRTMAVLMIANPVDVPYMLWVKLFVTSIVVVGIQLGTPIYLLWGWAEKISIVGTVPLFDMEPSTMPTKILGVSLATLICFKTFSRKVEDAYDANIYLIARRYVDPNKVPAPATSGAATDTENDKRGLLTKEDEEEMRAHHKFIKHFWLTLSMALKMIMCIITFFLCLCEVEVIEDMNYSSIVTTVTALYMVVDLDKTAIDLDPELKDRYRNYVGRFKLESPGYHQLTQDRYTLARKIFQQILQVITIFMILVTPFLQFQKGDKLIPGGEVAS
eukprot:CAMPEP_0197703250 /NCGR_PEP_ID=MMETSP1338-20131121/125341_1 /TAXON_ID=43686 ORGANISM="Pelagodinium beii, Strain RCC1491" /NCGR_SAMPLE_ID=MMETSP1338 /ASSEMBLY_ACC=CAM_ASM_000754 /LENGTH=454 /DNA_ID=CAMNT_0043287143 /DNA_START=46 /DNA_END=1410 /DNA_ORIENTATION=+